jgi:putative transposase
LGHTYTRLIGHIIFSTKERTAYLADSHRDAVFAYMGGILRELACEPLHINGVADHAHLMFRVSAILSLAEIVQKVKGNSSKWIHEQRVLPGSFAWQRGYAAFSVSESNAERVCRYIANQEAHHRQMSFQDELRAFLRQHGIEYDERYLWN